MSKRGIWVLDSEFDQLVENFRANSEVLATLRERFDRGEASWSHGEMRVEDLRGELQSLMDRMGRVFGQLQELHPAPGEKPTRGRRKGNGDGQRETIPALMAAIRALFESIENRVAYALPHRSSGTLRYRFHGTKRMTRADGDAVRSDFHRLGKFETLVLWCLPGKLGVSDGTGPYTRSQVEAALAQDVGGHRRRREKAREARGDKGGASAG